MMTLSPQAEQRLFILRRGTEKQASKPPVKFRRTGETKMNEDIKVWSIGEDSELFAGHSEEEVKRFYTTLVGEDDALQAIEDHFELVAEGESLNDEHEYNCDGAKRMLSFRQLIELCGSMPMQISTSYN